MRILYIHQYFKTPEDGGCIRSYHLAKGLVAAGHEVTMITAHHEKEEIKHIEGIQVIYLSAPYDNSFGFLKRIKAFLQFVSKSKKAVKALPQTFDLAYVMTTPLTTGLIALHLKRNLGIPYYFEVGDIWPEAPIQIGAIKNQWIKNRLYAFEKRCYQEAEKVIGLSPAIAAHAKNVSRQTAVDVIPNFSDTQLFEPTYRTSSINHDQPLRIGYFGTFGPANDLTTLINVAQQCQETSVPVNFTLMGAGKEYEKIRQLSQSLENVDVLPFGNTASVKAKMDEQDAVYVSFKNIPILNTGSPNKFFDGLAAGKLIIINFEGWIKEVIETNQCGFYHAPDNPGSFIKQLTPFVEDISLLISYQQSSRRLAESTFSKDLQVKKLLEVIPPEN